MAKTPQDFIRILQDLPAGISGFRRLIRTGKVSIDEMQHLILLIPPEYQKVLTSLLGLSGQPQMSIEQVHASTGISTYKLTKLLYGVSRVSILMIQRIEDGALGEISTAPDAAPIDPVHRQPSAERLSLVSHHQPFLGSDFFYPAIVFAGVLILHGTEGVPSYYTLGFGHWLAKYGYAVLCFGWCGDVTGLPPGPRNIDLARTFQALAWLRDQMKGRKVVVAGFSGGAEQAAIIGALAGQHAASTEQNELTLPDGLILHTPNDVIGPGWLWSWSDPEDPWNFLSETEKHSEVSAWRMANFSLQTGDRIPIENYLGPVLLSHGKDDQMCPVDRSKHIETALLKNPGRIHKVRTLFLPGEGHTYSPRGEKRFGEAVLEFLYEL